MTIAVDLGRKATKQAKNKRVGISGTTAKSRKFVPSSHLGPFEVVASSRKRQAKVCTLACFDVL